MADEAGSAGGHAVMPPPASPATGGTRTSGRISKPTEKAMRYNEDGFDSDEDGEDDDDYEASHGRRRSSRSTRGTGTLRSALKSADSAEATTFIRPPRVKGVKLSLKSGHQHRGRVDLTGKNKNYPYMQGYDRELDSSDEETGEGMAFEEQIILRMPEGHEATRKLGEWVRRREVGTDGREVEFKFKDSRRAVFKMGDQIFASKLVDLPAIIESHKTLDHKQLFKIADISQMLLVTNEVSEEADVTRGLGVQVEGLTDDFVYDHGITPPMKWARKRRFRKRIHKRTIETVEKEVERLLGEDERAEKIEYNMIDVTEADNSDSDGEGGGQGRRRGLDGDSTMGDGASTMADGEERSQMGDMDDMSMMADDDDFDQDLQRELEQEMLLQQQEEEEIEDDEASSAGGRRSRQRSMSRATSDDEEEEDDDDFDDDLFDAGEGDVAAAANTTTQQADTAATGAEEDDDDDDLDEDEQERRVRAQQLEAECREIEAMVKRRQAEIEGIANQIMKQRNLAALRRIQTELDMKRSQLAELRRERREGKEAARAEARAQAEEAAAASAAAAEVTGDTDKAEQGADDSLFGDDNAATSAVRAKKVSDTSQSKGGMGAARVNAVAIDDAEAADDSRDREEDEDEDDEEIGDEDEEEEEEEEEDGEEEEEEGVEDEDEGEGEEEEDEGDEGGEDDEEEGEGEEDDDEGEGDEGDEDGSEDDDQGEDNDEDGEDGDEDDLFS